MTVLTLVRSELRRLTATRLGVLAFVALMAVPLLYGGLYLWGNKDPYGRFSQVPAGVVVADRGTAEDGRVVNRGRTAADALVADGSFAWRELTPDAAQRELADGGVDFVVTFPATFSADLGSVGTEDPAKARIGLTTNDANSYLSSTIAKSVTTEVRDGIARQVGTSAATRYLAGLATVRTKLADASSGAGTLAAGAAAARDGAARSAAGAAGVSSGAERLASGASSAAAGADALADGLGTLADRSRDLPAGAGRVADGAGRVASGNAALASALREAASGTATAQALSRRLAADGLSPAQIQQALAVLQPDRAALSRAAGDADSLAAGARSVATGAARVRSGGASLAAAAVQARAGARSVADGTARVAAGARQEATGASRLATGSASLSTGAAKVASGAAALRDGLAKGEAAIPASTAAQRAAQAHAIGDPVAVRTTGTTSAGSYGAGLAPLFLSLSAWIGSYALFLILRPLSRRAITAVRQPIRVALAGWLTPALLGAAQMAALLAIAAGPLGIHLADPVATLGVLLLTAGTFAAVLLLLNAALGSVGQFLGLLLMLVQLVTAGGTFPWQTLPAPLAAVHHALPMAYAVDALRQTMYGGDAALAWGDAGVLGAWLAVALLLTAAIAARQTRRRTLRDLQPSLIGA